MKPFTLTASDFNDLVSSLAPPEWACSWDNVGFQIGSPRKKVQRALCALEVTPAVIAEAENKKAQIILAHHPLIFHPVGSVLDGNPVGDLIMRLVRKNLCLIVAHTNLDKSPYGTNRALASLLGLSEIDVMEPEGEMSGGLKYGMGCIGNLRRPAPLGRYAQKVRDLLRVKNAQVVGDEARRIVRVAVISGSGGDVIHKGTLNGADVLVTGEITHHTALEAMMRGMAVICAGHFATEAPGMTFFAQQLAKQDKIKRSGMEILIAKSQTPPYRYY
ncbi:Nif3-like dinuclear metal center hexameric protein [Candidatus Sumerlaeota bacterium]|nr:Nif3-like dinuclear metal center hexameric protein [Candidatus Sumerlaeota bacterium]